MTDKTKGKRIIFKVSPEQDEALRKAAANAGVNMTALIHRALETQLTASGQTYPRNENPPGNPNLVKKTA